ncbi:DUF1571 domain-containing protein [Reichenbachiella agariperforans]|uniref:LysM domain-containing protein n=1 Tax=Reichenbachiella agariperforans TaxID=156994 RepID=A0A1M6NXD4_REIAG|nr:DUF1571 domain-containing protein [Reichenbachiella agariperforans]MBU2916081.1 DUF1571 domain-containing protein [Reichenbachiella agariperforans]SHK00407.1 LysM domain-containing protein [Reichenbachiella agariperforans]
MKIKFVLAIGILAILTSFDGAVKLSVTEKVKAVFKSTQEIRSMSYDFVRHERINGKMYENTAFIKMQKKPTRIYYREASPNKGLEVLYPHPEDASQALVNPNGFPYVNMKLDPRGDLMTKNQHYSILDAGYDGVISVVEYLFYKYKNELDELVEYKGLTLYDGRTCDLVVMKNPSFQYINYPVSRGETVASIAKKYRLSEYMIKEKNRDMYMDELQEGSVIKLPTDYASKMALYIDVDRRIPLRIDIYDEVGLFEKYEFKNVTLNPGFKEVEFLDTFEGYSFN